MVTFGEKLRRERELRGVTLPELARATRINPHHLRSLEDEQFDSLPGGVINRGFVRSISRYLKLDEEYWVREYVQAASEEPARGTGPVSLRERMAGSARRRAATAVLLLALFGGGAYAINYFQRQQRTRSPVPAGQSPPALATDSQPAGNQPPAAAATPETQPSSPGTAPDPSPALSAETDPTDPVRVVAQELRLQIDILEEAWISVTADGKNVYEGILKAGDTRSLTARENFEITTRHASAVVLTLNGETLAPLGFPGETKTVTLTTQKQPPPPARQ